MTAFDLIILDILLPEKDGLEVRCDLRRRRKSLRYSNFLENADVGEGRLENQLYQDRQRFADTYKQALLDRQEHTSLHRNCFPKRWIER